MLWNVNRFSGAMELNAPNDYGTASKRQGSTPLARVVSRIIDYLNEARRRTSTTQSYLAPIRCFEASAHSAITVK